jgi:hypothetical protein
VAAKGGAPNTPPNGPPPSAIQTAPNVVAFDPKLVVPSQPLYFQRNDRISFNIISNIAGSSVKIDYRWLTVEGEIKEGEFLTGQFNFTFNANIALYEGWLLSFGAIQLTLPSTAVWTFLQAAIARAAPAVPSTAAAIFWQGFISVNTSNGWPGIVNKELTDGPGFIRSVTGSTPAAGAEINEVVPAQRRWQLISLRAQLTSNATVANRFPGFSLDDGVNQYFATHSNVPQVASTIAGYIATPGNQFFNDGQNNFMLPFCSLVPLKAAFRIRTTTVGLQAGDQWAAPQYVVLEWGNWDA